MERKPFFSVIVPVYNTEKYIEKAIYSLISQTFQRIEIIIIDDNSSDNTSNICDLLAYNYHFIKVIHLQENKGVSNARNIGIDIARGEYISFIDADDYVDKDFYEKIYLCLINNECDVLMVGVKEEYFDQKGNIKKNNIIDVKNGIYEYQDIYNIMPKYFKNTLFRYVCNKCYKRKYLYRIKVKFKNMKMGEDVDFNIAVFLDIERFITLEKCYYHYIKSNTNSATSGFIENYWDIHIGLLNKEIDLFKIWRKQKETEEFIYIEYIKVIYISLQLTYYKEALMNNRKRINFLNDVYKSKLYMKLQERINCITEKKYYLLARTLQSKNRYIILFVSYIIFLLKSRFIGIWFILKQR